MAIASLDDYLASSKQGIPFTKTATRVTVAASWFSVFDLAGMPGAGTLAGTSTAAGVVPDDTVAGYMPVNAFGGGAIGYLSKVDFGSAQASRLALYDRLFVAGAYAFNANTTLASQPSYSARVPNTDYSVCELWLECVTAFTGNLNITVTYTNQAGTTGKSTTFAPATAPTAGRCWQIPLAAGDTGIQKIETIVSSTATVGTFNLMVLRELWTGRVRIANDGDVHDMIRTGLRRVYDTSALYLLVSPDGTSSGVCDLKIEIANK